MPKISIKLTLISLLLAGEAGAAVFSPDRPQALERHVEFLSDSICAGRRSGTPGSVEACSYIIRTLEGRGLKAEAHAFVYADADGNQIIGRNVVVDGGASDPVVIIAGYDGYGVADGRLFPGADANASGVAALLEIAPSLKGDFVIAFLDCRLMRYGGAADLLHTTLKGRRPRLVVNLDCIGTTLAPVHRTWPEFLIALGAKQCACAGKPASAVLEEICARHDIHVYFDYYQSRDFTELFYRRIGDHTVFVSAGVNAVVFTSGVTMNTNRTTDGFRTLDYPVFAARVDIIEEFLKKYERRR